MSAVALIVLAYLLGSFPSGVVLSRLVVGRDVREVGSGNIGAANAARAGGIKVGLGVALLDILKGVVPVLVGRSIGAGDEVLALVAVVAVLGHDFSMFVGFRGGKGVATTLGVALALAPLAGVVAALLWIGAVAVWRYTSLGSLIALAALPLLIALTGGAPVFVVAATILFLLGAAKHWENIARLLSGTERRFRARTSDGT